MSSFDYAALKASAVVPNLKRMGTQVTYRSFTEAFNPATGENVRTPVDTTAYAVFGDFKLSVIDGTLVQRGDKRLLIAEIPEPRAGDQVIAGAVTHTVVGPTNSIAPAGAAVLYEVQVRR